MRFIRRTLLCLVVGVTAFGAAGWGLKPRPTWSVPLESGPIHEMFLSHSLAGQNHEPIWIEANDLSDVTVDAKSYIAFDPRTGKRLRSWTKPPEWRPDSEIPDSDRLLLFRSAKENPDGSGAEFWNVYVDPTIEPKLIRMEGEWKIADDYIHAWRAEYVDGGLIVQRRRMSDGAALPPITLKGQLPDSRGRRIDYSANQNLIAVAKARDDDDEGGFEAILIEASSGRVVRTLKPDLTDKVVKGPLTSVHFGGVGESVHLWAGVSPNFGSWEFRVSDGAPIVAHPVTPPKDAEGKVDFDYDLSDVDGQVVVANCIEPPASWVTLHRADETETQWHRIPAAVSLEYQIVCTVGGSAKSDHVVGAMATRIPQTDRMIVQTAEPSLTAMVPGALKGWLPGSLPAEEKEAVCRWHDWKTGAWRDVGCRHPDYVQVRTNELIVIASDAKEATVLESYPLPPRDPKPPAIIITALCMAGTWWLCARRYGRRMRLAGLTRSGR